MKRLIQKSTGKTYEYRCETDLAGVEEKLGISIFVCEDGTVETEDEDGYYHRNRDWEAEDFEAKKWRVCLHHGQSNEETEEMDTWEAVENYLSGNGLKALDFSWNDNNEDDGDFTVRPIVDEDWQGTEDDYNDEFSHGGYGSCLEEITY